MYSRTGTPGSVTRLSTRPSTRVSVTGRRYPPAGVCSPRTGRSATGRLQPGVGVGGHRVAQVLGQPRVARVVAGPEVRAVGVQRAERREAAPVRRPEPAHQRVVLTDGGQDVRVVDRLAGVDEVDQARLDRGRLRVDRAVVLGGPGRGAPGALGEVLAHTFAVPLDQFGLVAGAPLGVPLRVEALEEILVGHRAASFQFRYGALDR